MQVYATMDDCSVSRLALTETLHGHVGCVNRLAWTEEGGYLASVSDDTNIIVWPYPTGKGYVVPTLHTSNVFGVQFLPRTNGTVLVTGAMDETVRLHRLNTYGEKLPCVGRRSWVEGSQNEDLQSLTGHSTEFRCHSGRVKDVEVTPSDPSVFWSASEDGTVRQFDVRVNTRDQSKQESANVLVYHRNGALSVRVNQARPELMAVSFHHEDVRVYDRRKLGLLSRSTRGSSTDSSDIGDPVMKLSDPSHDLQLVVHPAMKWDTLDWSGARIRSATYVSFNSRGDKLLASFSEGPAVCWSVLTSDVDSTKSNVIAPNLQSKECGPSCEFEPIDSTKDLYFYGYGDASGCKESLKKIKRPPQQDVRRTHSALHIRKAKQVVADNPYNYIAHFNLCEEYLFRKLSFQDLYCALSHAEYAVRLAPDNDVDPYLALLEVLSKLGFDYAAQFIVSVMRLKLKDKCPPESFLLARGCLNRDGPMQTHFDSEVLGFDFDEFLQEFLRGTNYQKIMQKIKFMNMCETEYQYIAAWGISCSKKAPTPIYSLGHKEKRYLQSYRYHYNKMTDIKEAVFFGSEDQYIIAGSDSGHALIYEAGCGEVVSFLLADEDIVNCVRPHPTLPVIATSGIESTVKLWSPFDGKVENLVFNDNEVLSDVSNIEASHALNPMYTLFNTTMNPIISLLADRIHRSMMDPEEDADSDEEDEGDELLEYDDGDSLHLLSSDDWESDEEYQEYLSYYQDVYGLQ